MRLRELLFVLAIVPSLALAQSTIKLNFPSEGEREVWIADQLVAPASTLKAEGKTLEIPKQGGGKDRLFVWDRKSGNVATKLVTELKDSWTLTDKDFNLVGKVTVQVEHENKPVAVAFVRLKAQNQVKETQLDAKKEGKATFFGVPAGKVDVTVNYTSEGADAEPAVQSFNLGTKRSDPDPVFTIALSKPVETVRSPDEPATKEESPDDKREAESKQNPAGTFGTIIIYLLGLGVAIGAIYFGLKYMKDHQDKLKTHLEQVGVQVPGPLDANAPADPAPAPAPLQPAPQQRIILNDADPGIFPTPPPAAHTVSTSEPRLVMANGDVFTIPEGETTVGREATNGLALVAETTVSRRHASLTKTGDEISVRDEGSSNGTFVNGRKIDDSTVLRPGDMVQFGQAVFRFEA